jgi:hypothetical protein
MHQILKTPYFPQFRTHLIQRKTQWSSQENKQINNQLFSYTIFFTLENINTSNLFMPNYKILLKMSFI